MAQANSPPQPDGPQQTAAVAEPLAGVSALDQSESQNAARQPPALDISTVDEPPAMQQNRAPVIESPATAYEQLSDSYLSPSRPAQSPTWGEALAAAAAGPETSDSREPMGGPWGERGLTQVASALQPGNNAPDARSSAEAARRPWVDLPEMASAVPLSGSAADDWSGGGMALPAEKSWGEALKEEVIFHTFCSIYHWQKHKYQGLHFG